MVLPLINSLAIFSLGYILGQENPKEAPESGDYSPPYTPPFLGGQCNTQYICTVNATLAGTLGGSPFSKPSSTAPFFVNGKINSLELSPVVSAFGGAAYSSAVIVNGVQLQSIFWFQSSGNIGEPIFESVIGRTPSLGSVSLNRTDGLPDNCGNLPNPNPSLPTNDSGLASGGSSPTDEPQPEVLGAPLAPVSPFLSALLAALAAAKAAADALGAIGAIADAISSIADLLDKIREELNEKDKEKDGKKEILSYYFGDIEKDGFLRFYPNESFVDCEAKQLDILITAIPIGYGKYFGRFSPNYFEYKRLGHIAFVSGTFGIIEKREIEFGRCSFSIPEGSIGFYYHLGLDGNVKARATAFYLREQAE